MRAFVALVAFVSPLAMSVERAAAAPSPDRSSPERYRLEFSSEPGCVSRATFVAAVQARSSNIVLTDATAPDGGAAARALTLQGVVTVAIAATHDGAEGTLRIASSDSGAPAPEPRVVGGESCAAVARALALAAALTLDPTASIGARPTLAEPSGDGSTPPSRDSAVAPAREPSALRLGVGAEGLVTTVFGGLVGGAAYGDALWAPRAGAAFAARVALAGTTLGTVRPDTGEGAFRLLWGRLEGCPLVVGGAPSAVASVQACARADAGVVFGRGRDVPAPRDETRPWIAVGPAARVALRPQRALELHVGAGVGFPLVRERFFFEPSITIAEPPVAVIEASAGATMRLF